MMRLQEGAAVCAMVALYVSSRFPLLRLGFGNDSDAWSMASNASDVVHGTYRVPRLPGHPVYEALYSTAAVVGGSLVCNLLTVGRVARRYPLGLVPEVLVRYRGQSENMHRNVDAMTRDMLAAYAKVFSEQDPELQRLRRWGYGRLHAMLAGSFFQAGEYRRFARHAAASVAARPGQVGYFAGYPVRALRRCLSASRVG